MENLPALIEKLNHPNTFIHGSPAFKKDYDELFKDDPMQANVYLLFNEIADETGQIEITEDEIEILFTMRFKDPKAYQLNSDK